MADTIDKANADYERWLNGKIKQCQITPANNITECLDCGEPIGEKRKTAVPYAVQCIACQSEFERGK